MGDSSSTLSPTDRQVLEKLKEQIKEKGLMEGEAFARAGEVVAEAVSSKESKSSSTKTSMSTQESVKIVNGGKTIVDGVVVSSTSETIPMQGGKGEAIQEEDDEEDFDESDYDQLDQEEDEDEAVKDEL